jgi:hypothetical protein
MAARRDAGQWITALCVALAQGRNFIQAISQECQKSFFNRNQKSILKNG